MMHERWLHAAMHCCGNLKILVAAVRRGSVQCGIFVKRLLPAFVSEKNTTQQYDVQQYDACCARYARPS